MSTAFSRWLLGWPVVLLLLAGYWFAAVTATLEKSATFDEPLHLYAAWRARGGDTSYNPEHPALVKRVAGLALGGEAAPDASSEVVEDTENHERRSG